MRQFVCILRQKQIDFKLFHYVIYLDLYLLVD